MNTINEILEEQGFTPEEKEVFLDIINQAKTLQRNLMLEDLNSYMNEKITEIAHENQKY